MSQSASDDAARTKAIDDLMLRIITSLQNNTLYDLNRDEYGLLKSIFPKFSRGTGGTTIPTSMTEDELVDARNSNVGGRVFILMTLNDKAAWLPATINPDIDDNGVGSITVSGKDSLGSYFIGKMLQGFEVHHYDKVPSRINFPQKQVDINSIVPFVAPFYATIVDLSGKLQNANNQINQLQQNAAAASGSTQAQQQIVDLNNTINQLRNQNSSLDNEIANLRNQLQQAQQQANNNNNNNNGNNNNAMNQLQNENNRLNNQVNDLNRQLDQARRQQFGDAHLFRPGNAGVDQSIAGLVNNNSAQATKLATSPDVKAATAPHLLYSEKDVSDAEGGRIPDCCNPFRPETWMVVFMHSNEPVPKLVEFLVGKVSAGIQSQIKKYKTGNESYARKAVMDHYSEHILFPHLKKMADFVTASSDSMSPPDLGRYFMTSAPAMVETQKHIMFIAACADYAHTMKQSLELSSQTHFFNEDNALAARHKSNSSAHAPLANNNNRGGWGKNKNRGGPYSKRGGNGGGAKNDQSSH